jgi:hypothetical protein
LNICTCVCTSSIVLWEISMRSLVRSLCLYSYDALFLCSIWLITSTHIKFFVYYHWII